MTNKEIAKAFDYLADLMELHQENPFKIRSYRNAYLTLRKWPEPLESMSEEELASIKGIGSAISKKIKELAQTGTLQAIEKYEALTPPGIRELLQVPGIGPKKVRVLWKELGVESPGELLYACNENRLIELKGFGKKTQEDLRQKLLYYEKHKSEFLYASVEDEAESLLEKLRALNPDLNIEITGAFRRRDPVLSQVELIISGELEAGELFAELKPSKVADQSVLRGKTAAAETPVTIYLSNPREFGSKQFRFTGSGEFLRHFIETFKGVDFRNLPDERQVFEKAGIPFIAPELRNDPRYIDLARQQALPELIRREDIRGVVHAHSTYSDGINTLRDMAVVCIAKGFEYLVISDHSRSAFYANGLDVERLHQQWEEIDRLNAELAPFRIFKGIESDILNDGSLDYDDHVLESFDIVIASVHSNLKMDEKKATERLLKAIEHPATKILGHPTGRLLLSRPGYPIDHQRIIEACARHGVVIELNANPYRLDLDWSWIPTAVEAGVHISINPDAHSTTGIDDIRYGVYAARKGGLSKRHCVNCLSLPDFLRFFGLS